MKKHIRVIVRPWVPRNIPYTIPAENVRQVLSFAYPKLKKVLYIGWARRRVNGKRVLCYLAATADTTLSARRILKLSESYGEEVWNLGPM
jgi:hypothetical protein